MNKIYLFKDQNDYIKKLTDDEITNIIGTKGSGKTTSSIKYIDNDEVVDKYSNYGTMDNCENIRTNKYPSIASTLKCERTVKSTKIATITNNGILLNNKLFNKIG